MTLFPTFHQFNLIIHHHLPHVNHFDIFNIYLILDKL